MTTLKAAARNKIETGAFAFPKERKEPLENASHVRNAIARFNQVEGVTDTERDAAWKRIRAAAKKHGVEVNETSWREVGKAGAGKPSAKPKASGAKTAKEKPAAR